MIQFADVIVELIQEIAWNGARTCDVIFVTFLQQLIQTSMIFIRYPKCGYYISDKLDTHALTHTLYFLIHTNAVSYFQWTSDQYGPNNLWIRGIFISSQMFTKSILWKFQLTIYSALVWILFFCFHWESSAIIENVWFDYFNFNKINQVGFFFK